MHLRADFSLQGDTTNIRAIGAPHRQHIGPGLQCQFGRHAIGVFRLCFGPVESDAKCSTAGAALLARMAHAVMITQTKKRRVESTPFFVLQKLETYFMSNSTVCTGVFFNETSTLYLPAARPLNLKLLVALPSGEICVPSS